MTAISDQQIPDIPRRMSWISLVNLVNLQLRGMDHKITVLDIDAEKELDPEFHVVTKIEWRDRDISKPILPQLPRILSLLETLRSSRGVPREIYLDSFEGVPVYLPMGLRVSDMPESPSEAVDLLIKRLVSTLVHHLSTMQEIETWFWNAARRKGFGEAIVERMGRKEKFYDSQALLLRFYNLLYSYFSIRFRIHRAESCIRLEV